MRFTPDELDARYRELIQSISDTVSPFGEVEGPEDRAARVDRARRDKAFFKRTYFPHYARQRDPEYVGLVRDVLDARGRPQLLLGFRGCGKSTDVSLIDAAHEILYGTAHFFVFVSRSREIAAAEYAIPLKAELAVNPRIINDFGAPAIKGDELDYIVNDVRVKSTGIKSFPRGQKHGPWRPDRIRIEDIEDNANRMSPAIQKKALRIITDDIMKSVGTGIDEPWSVVVNGNYFSRRSLLHRLRTSGLFRVTIIKSLRPVSPHETRDDAVDGMVSTWPERFPTAQLARERAKSPVTFKIEMQQEPDDDDGAFRREWFRRYRPGDVRPDGPHYLGRYGWVDPSPGEKESSDYKAYGFGDFYLDDGELVMYLGEAYCRQETVNEMLRRIFDVQRRNPTIRLWGFEMVSSEYYLQKLIDKMTVTERLSLPTFPVMRNLPGFPWKKDRIPQMQSHLERGQCYVLAKDYDHERIVEQYCDWPEAEYDDGPDFHSGLFKLGEMMTIGQNVLL